MKNKVKSLKFFLAIVGTAFLVGFISLAGWFSASPNSSDNQDPAKLKEMMALVLEWGQLAPFPASAINVEIATEGSSFTRSFRASFIAPKQDIQSWIKASPGLNETTPETLYDNKVKYIIAPGGGASSAEVTIDYALNKVEIYVSWS
jgi:hypothetical protein